MRKHLLIITLFVLTGFCVSAQQINIEKIEKLKRAEFGAIKEGTDVKGYFFFYPSDKIDKKNYEWTLLITDIALKTLKQVKLQESKDIQILETSFNGSELMMLFYNDDDRTFDYQVYAADGKKKFSYNRQLTKKEEKYLEQSYLSDDDEDNFKGLYPIEGKGFISNMPSREDKDYTFQVDFFATDRRKQWTYIPGMDGKKFVGDYLGTFNGVVYIEVLKFASKMDGKPESSIVGLNLETGKQIFEKPTDGKYRFYPASMSTMNEGKSYIYGEYFNLDDNIGKDKSLGFGFWSMDEKGKIVSEKYISWETDLGRYLDVNSKGKIDDFGFMFLHNMVQTSDGTIYAIGEGFKKVASALGIASQMLSRGRGNVSTIKLKVTDMLLVKFDKDFNVKDARIYEKRSSSIELRSGMEFVSAPLMGKLIKYNFGRFDYAYTQINKDRTSFNVAYSDYERGKDYKGTTFNSITYRDGKITTDKIQTRADGNWAVVLP
ncbi:MAG TPA: DUF6770 family protein, partial [Chitinophagaceae bacterium]|nr:DUF6770 family protein [Chitinophagaceae bacterium]